MKIFLILVLCFGLSGCFKPRFYPSEQKIEIIHAPGIDLKINDELKQSQPPNSVQKLTVDRSFRDLEILLTKEGFENKTITIPSHLTNDLWANESSFGGRHTASAWCLTPPIGTFTWTILGFSAGLAAPIAAAYEKGGIAWGLVVFTPITTVIGTATGFVAGVGTDIYNTVFGIPAVILANPWYEYDQQIDLSKEVLSPTPDFEKKCHTSKNKFIGDYECLSCKVNKDVSATETECNRCSNREWNNNSCILICQSNTFRSRNKCISCDTDYPLYDYETTQEECHKCPNREWVNNMCRKKLLPPKKLPPNFEQTCHDKHGIIENQTCILCNSEQKATVEEAECSRCSEREIWGDMCVLKCSQNQFRKSTGVCATCEDKSSHRTTKDECQKCPNREWQDGICRLKN